MWNLINCYLSGRHDFGVSCGSGAVFLRCTHCGKRSSGWSIDAKPRVSATPAPSAVLTAPPMTITSRVLPFDRAAAAR